MRSFLQLLLAFIIVGLFSFTEDSRILSSIAASTNSVLTSKAFAVKGSIYDALVSMETDEEAIEEIDEDDDFHLYVGLSNTSYRLFNSGFLYALLRYHIVLVKRKLFLLYLALKVDYCPSLLA
ncbi:MAG TPA: hypothetical protein PKH93_09305 [Chitinophagales bacterium]|nr:hypothetical protein [Chitinophagales bacterium]